MNADFSILLPFPLSMNAIHRSFNANGRNAAILSSKARQWLDAAIPEIRGSVNDSAINGDVRVSVVYTRPLNKDGTPSQKTRDVHNLHKLLLDACTRAGLWEDDSQVTSFECRWAKPEEFEVFPIHYKRERKMKTNPLPVLGGVRVNVYVLENNDAVMA